MKAGMREQLRLRRDGGHHLRMAVPGVDDGDARGEIDEALTVGVPNFRILGLGNVDAFGAHAVGDGRRFTSLQICRFRHGPPEMRFRAAKRYHWSWF
jgi:hypothetical protein